MGQRGNIARIKMGESGLALEIGYTHSGAYEIVDMLAEGPERFAEHLKVHLEMREEEDWLDDIWSEGSCLVDEWNEVILIHREDGRPWDRGSDPNLIGWAKRIEKAWPNFTVVHVDEIHEIVRYAYYRGLATFEEFKESWRLDEEDHRVWLKGVLGEGEWSAEERAVLQKLMERTAMGEEKEEEAFDERMEALKPEYKPGDPVSFSATRGWKIEAGEERDLDLLDENRIHLHSMDRHVEAPWRVRGLNVVVSRVGLLITSIQVDGREQLAVSQPVPIEAFSGPGTGLELDSGSRVTVRVKNTTNEELTLALGFRAFGRIVQVEKPS